MAGRKPLDLTGQRFGRLVVLGKSEKKDPDGSMLWDCRCDCGALTVAKSFRQGDE